MGFVVKATVGVLFPFSADMLCFNSTLILYKFQWGSEAVSFHLQCPPPWPLRALGCVCMKCLCGVVWLPLLSGMPGMQVTLLAVVPAHRTTANWSGSGRGIERHRCVNDPPPPIYRWPGGGSGPVRLTVTGYCWQETCAGVCAPRQSWSFRTCISFKCWRHGSEQLSPQHF